MKKLALLIVLTLFAACASDAEEKEKSPKEQMNEAIDDFVKVSELEPVSRIRASGEIHHEVITEDYVYVRDRRNTWLVEFANTCYDIEGPRVRPDVRQDSKMLRAKFDTIRGCRIAAIYPVTDGMVEEIDGLIKPYE